ncbi:RagB/SusD family nutrient uptake outer membrane protein [Sphingobacterium spiritivorum]|uniref:RagB/SusD family nutrient uptake outer membrane protein n=1 Tax=Sphingobacterium spiritivorum TaxID=258 RepID=UPI003DA342C7
MKIRITYIILATLTSMLVACNQDFLTRDNPTATTDDKWWNLESDLRNYLEIVYNNSIPSGALLTNPGFQANARMHMSGTSDDNVFFANFGSWGSFPQGAATSSDGYMTELYRRNYIDIRDCSRILENYQQVYIEDQNLKERYAAEARALRAYAHLKLFQFFGPIPVVAKSITFDEASNIPRSSEADVVKFISTELDNASRILPASYNSTDAYRMTKGACYAMQIQLYLQVKDYEKVIEYARKLIDLNVYDLHYATNQNTTNSYADLFSYNAQESKERIVFRRSGSQGAFFRFSPRSLGGQATNSPTAAIVNTYETRQGKTLEELGNDSLMIYWKNPLYKNNRDPRLQASVFVPGQTFLNRRLDPFNGTADPLGVLQSTQTGFWVRKYVDASDVSKPNSGSLNFIVIRYAEVLLSYVEALVESGQWQHPDVKIYLNKIRNRAKMPDYNELVYNSQEKLRELYRRERRVELAFEGQRIFDIRRWRIGEEVLRGPVQGAINPATNQPVVAETRVFDPNRDYLWPIPLNETNANTAMQQNPGW